jgi:hypothetical protein
LPGLYRDGTDKTRKPTTSVWSQVFIEGKPTFIVAGDAGLNIFENISRREVDFDEYSTRSYLNSQEAKTPPGYSWDPLATRTYTTIQDLQMSAHLAELPEARTASPHFLPARDLTMDDLKNSNAILLSSPQYDP